VRQDYASGRVHISRTFLAKHTHHAWDGPSSVLRTLPHTQQACHQGQFKSPCMSDVEKYTQYRPKQDFGLIPAKVGGLATWAAADHGRKYPDLTSSWQMHTLNSSKQLLKACTNVIIHECSNTLRFSVRSLPGCTPDSSLYTRVSSLSDLKWTSSYL